MVVKTAAEAPDALFHTPDGIGDEVASTLPVAGHTAAAALAAIGLGPGDIVLIAGAAGGVGVARRSARARGPAVPKRNYDGGERQVPDAEGTVRRQ